MEKAISPSTYGVQSDIDAAVSAAPDKALISLALIAGLLALRWALVRLIRRQSEILTDRQLRAIAIVRNGGVIALLIALFILWLPELEAFALSVTAVAVAIVIATKELLMCFAGGLVRSTSGSFSAGDWIEVNGHSGEVGDTSLLSTTLLEFDADRMEYTGRLVTLPNSVFLANPVRNHEFHKKFVFHEFTIYSELIPKVEAARQAILKALDAEARAFEDVAARYAAMIERRMGVRLPPATPRVRVRTTEAAKLGFEVTMFCPREKALDIEAVAMTAFQKWVERQPWRFAMVAAKPTAETRDTA
jgi:small-conductance mechanosensitive channel